MRTRDILWANRSNWRLVLQAIYILHNTTIKIVGTLLLLVVAAIIAWLTVSGL